MKKSSTIFLQIVIVALGIGVFTWMLWEPHFEGRNVNASAFEIYFKDPFLACAYIGSIAFFVGLYQAFKLLGYVRKNKIFSEAAVKALRTIKYCAMIIIGFVVAGLVYIFIAIRGKDDIAGGVAMGLFIIFVSLIITAAAATFEWILRNGMELKSKIIKIIKNEPR